MIVLSLSFTEGLPNYLSKTAIQIKSFALYNKMKMYPRKFINIILDKD